MKVAIIGAGISGLSAAYYLKRKSIKKNLELTLFDSSDKVGGVINTFRSDGIILEHGPDSFIMSKPWGIQLINELGLKENLLSTNENNRRTFVYFNKKLNKLPDGFFLLAPSKILPFLFSNFFSFFGKIRILLETVIPRKKTYDESLYSFVTRRFGKELFNRAAQPLISGIYTANPHKLSVRSTMPHFLDMEKNDGSIIRSLLKKSVFNNKNQSGARYNLFVTLKNGMISIIEKLLENINFNSVNLNTEILDIRVDKNGWNLRTKDGKKLFDAVVLSCSSHSSSQILSKMDLELSKELADFKYASSVVVNLIFNKADFPNPPKGFGVVIPSSEKLNLIACSFYSQKFPERVVGKNKIVLRCFMGGELNQEITRLDDDELINILEIELIKIFGIKNFSPRFFIKRYPRSLPQFEIGHSHKIGKVFGLVSKYRGLALCGSLYYGVGIADCIRSGKIAAEKIHKDINGV